MSDEVVVAFAHWRLVFRSTSSELRDIVSERYGGFLEDVTETSPARSTVTLQLEWDDALGGEHPTRFSVRHEGDDAMWITSGALRGALDPAGGEGRIGVIARRAAGFAERMPHMAIENYLRIAVANLAPAVGAALVHSAAVSRVSGESAVLLHGPSGAGKSTAAALSVAADPRHRVFSDDLVVVDAGDGGCARVHATPFWGDDPPVDRPRGSLPIAAICELRQATHHEACPVPVTEGIGGLVSAIPFQSFLTPPRVARLLQVAEGVASSVACYTLRFRRDSGFWVELERALDPDPIPEPEPEPDPETSTNARCQEAEPS